MKVALYARVSSENQAEKDLSIPSQLKVMREYAKKNNWQIVEEYVDPGFSARTADRPAFQEMMSRVRHKEKPIDIILVWKLNRFARNREDSYVYKNLIRKHGVEVISCSEPIDDTPAGQLLEGILETMDEFFSINLAQDTLRGMKENAERGYWNGGKPPIGYKKVPVQVGSNVRNKLALDPLFSSVIKRIFKAYIDGEGACSIATTLNLEGLKTDLNKPWNKNTIYHILCDEAYTGTLVFNKRCQRKGHQRKKDSKEIIRIENSHEAIIDKATFNKVQRIRKQRNPGLQHPRTAKSEYLLSGLLYCGNCNSAMIGCAAKSSTVFYYRCRKSHQEGKHVCGAKLVNRKEIESTVLKEIKMNILSEENLKEIVRLTNNELAEAKIKYKDEIETYNKQITDKNRRLNTIYEAIESGKLEIDNINHRLKHLEKGKRAIEYKMHNTEVQQIDFNTVKRYVKKLRPLLSKGTIAERRSFISSFVERVIVNYPEIEIHFTIPNVVTKKKASRVVL